MRRVVYDAIYPAGNVNTNVGLELYLITEMINIYGTDWILGRVTFNGSDGLAVNTVVATIRRTPAVIHLVHESTAGSVTNNTTYLRFNNANPGGWYAMNGVYERLC